jgi:hypothetical protein
MKMDAQIRVKTDSRYSRIYNDLKNVVVGDFHELFFVCACLGFKQRKSMPLGKNREDRFWSNTINPREWAVYYSMILEENGLDFKGVQDDKLVLGIIEEYANAGMDILRVRFLNDYLLNNKEEPQLDPSCSKELPKNFLHFIFDQIDNQVSGDNP